MNCSRGNSDQYRSQHPCSGSQDGSLSDNHVNTMFHKKMSGLFRGTCRVNLRLFAENLRLPQGDLRTCFIT